MGMLLPSSGGDDGTPLAACSEVAAGGVAAGGAWGRGTGRGGGDKEGGGRGGGAGRDGRGGAPREHWSRGGEAPFSMRFFLWDPLRLLLLDDDDDDDDTDDDDECLVLLGSGARGGGEAPESCALTISCLARFLRFIFIFRPLSTVAWCSTGGEAAAVAAEEAMGWSLLFSMSASRSMMRSPMPSSHSL